MQILKPEALQLAQWVRPGDRVVVAHSMAEPTTLLEALVAQRTGYAGAELFMHASFSGAVRAEHADALRLRGLGAVGSQRGLVATGALAVVPMHLSELWAALSSGSFAVDVALVQVSPPDENGRYSFGLVNDYQIAAVRRARVVIAEINDQVPQTCSDSWLTAEDIDAAIVTSRALPELPASRIGDVEQRIAAHVAPWLKDGATVQFGIGSVTDAIAGTLTDRRDLGVHSGVISDAFLTLLQAGAITNARKGVDRGVTVTGAIWGSRALYDFAHRNPSIRLCPLGYTHAASSFAALPDFVSLNSAIEVDLYGQCNLETADGAYIGAVGGSVDFVRGSRFAPGGRSIIALPSTAARGSRSRIVPVVQGPVTIARSDVDLVATEFGVAELRGKDVHERARSLIAVAHPDFREELERQVRSSPPAAHH
ncbi:MAG: acetyl-CoA hydrolase/transferase C-terminal domain-containing protein [Ottowia sp.]|uniref:acetyl-CoA hydrolase/transferase family protein n=1 Tax=Ottowia sp. TaxID=1898956 RepID=UPI003C7925CA